ncbi:peptide-N(4)-(N-acetyl-beta-glucosaminyl)asparagine amidase [Hylaeus volcanicus]|uniref:peptide-N(4)-(N-acetyl-beta- glucosaminyl)asparagine amidase n=1 Tax=Hylaeus volcanicus TaxID=313075 RepID=UPI0023B80269|nr:peptide-N(4)-(N-acetyl-beta-glucosaminyl)asparagine amidase [Hylaeus volcanicus]
MDKDLQRCLDLLKENEDHVRVDAESALLTVCQNILSHPNDKQYREVYLDNPVVEKLLPAAGAMECMFDIGFVEGADSLILPQEAPISKLQTLQNLLSKKSSVKRNTVNKTIAYYLLPETSDPKEKAFLASIIHQFQNVLQYEDPNLQAKARRVIPVTDLEIATMNRFRELQKLVKMSQRNPGKSTERRYKETDFDVRDLFLMELSHWFTYKFFKWVDSPVCPECLNSCEYHKVVPSMDPRCSRIEIHRCTKCDKLVKFPRYTDPEPLLSLRRGRCGEWVNVFTLFCRTLGYDARFVCDKTDHVWTEVWSINENRWIHIDPCEDVMDRPLMYEKGWKKQLTYIIAYSKDEVRDVTWRYTRNQLAVMKRRKLCTEKNLMQLIESLNKHRQCSPNYSASRRQYVRKRELMELAELIRVPGEQNYDDGETYRGRSTGSYSWRLARGEISQESTANFSWDVSKYGETFQLYYSVVKDTYKVTSNDGKILETVTGWQNGVNSEQGGIFRKLENDWKMVYLARSMGSTRGHVKWNFVVTNPNLCVSTFSLRAMVTTFHGANISWQIQAFFDDTPQSKSLMLPINDCTNYHTDQLKGSVKLILTATVSGGQGDCAWQHAQLFRQSLNAEEDESLIVHIQVTNR